MKSKVKNERLDNLEQRLVELEELSNKLDDKLSDIEATFDSLLVKFGAKVRKVATEEVDCRIEQIEYDMLKKLVDGEMFELKIREKGPKKYRR